MSQNADTIRMIKAYNQEADPTMFFTGMFRARAEGFHNSEKVQIDIQRTEEDISIVVTDPGTGYRVNSDDLYTEKTFIPPVHMESFPIKSQDLLKKNVGDDPYKDPTVKGTVIARAMRGFRLIENKIRRSIELQASQIMQTGTVTLTDIAGNALYTLSFQPKASHFPTASTAWGAVGADPLGDLLGLANVIRGDGLKDVDEFTFGENSFELAMADDNFKGRFETRRADLGSITPMELRGNGAQYRGVIEIGTYRFDIFTTNGRYTHPTTGVSTTFMDTNKVVAKASTMRADATFGNVPLVVRPDRRLMPLLPSRMRSSSRRTDLHPNIWVTPDNTQIMGGLASRPLLIPVAIDQFGCLDNGN